MAHRSKKIYEQIVYIMEFFFRELFYFVNYVYCVPNKYLFKEFLFQKLIFICILQSHLYSKNVDIIDLLNNPLFLVTLFIKYAF